MTEYRKINNGYWYFLQYKKQKRFLWVFKYYKWVSVWKPYYDEHWGRSLDPTGADCYVSSLSNNLEAFVEKWVDIEDYFIQAQKEQYALENKVIEKRKTIYFKKGEIIPFKLNNNN